MERYSRTIKFMLLLLIYLCLIPFFISIFFNVLSNAVGYNFLSSTFLMFITPFLCSLLPAVLYFSVTKENYKEVLSLNKISLSNVILIVIMAILIQPIANFVSYITSYLFTNTASEAMNSISDVPFWFFLLISAILPAIFEEVVFRGIILSGVRSAGVLKSALISGLFFGIIHLNPHQFIYAFLIGIVFALFVIYTKSIYSSILAHFIINGTQGFILYMSKNFYSQEELSVATQSDFSVASILYSGATAIVFGILFYFVFRYFTKKNEGNLIKSFDDAPQNLITIPFIIIIVLFIAYLLFRACIL